MNEKEKRIKEQRTIEATKKGLLGLGGKFGVILKNLGEPIISQDEGMNSDFLATPWDLPEEKESGELRGGTAEEIQSQISYMDVPGVEEPTGTGWRENRDDERQIVGVHEIGWTFSGLNRGMHIDIQYMLDTGELTVYYKGYLVYKEMAGNLLAYAPFPDWEDKIDGLYTSAKEIEKKRSKSEKQEDTKEGERIKRTWWQGVKQRWGL